MEAELCRWSTYDTMLSKEAGSAVPIKLITYDQIPGRTHMAADQHLGVLMYLRYSWDRSITYAYG